MCASVRAEQTRLCARSTHVSARGARVPGRARSTRSRPADPAFLLGRLLAERSRRLGPLEGDGSQAGESVVSPQRSRRLAAGESESESDFEDDAPAPPGAIPANNTSDLFEFFFREQARLAFLNRGN